MCPLCLSAAALIGGGIGSAGVLAAIILAVRRRPAKTPSAKEER
jgi:hypothetical protein